MNLSDDSFLCLDIGESTVRGMGVRVRNGRIAASALQACESFDTAFAIKSVADELDSALGTHFDSAFVTGGFGGIEVRLATKTSGWSGMRKVSANDIRAQLEEILRDTPCDAAALHIIPLRYDLSGFPNIRSPIGQTDTRLTSVFGMITAQRDVIASTASAMNAAHLEASGFFAYEYLIANTARKPTESVIIADFGASGTSFCVWTARGPVFAMRIPIGGKFVTDTIAAEFSISGAEAMRVKKSVCSAAQSEMDRFTPADPAYEFSRADIWDIMIPNLREIMDSAYTDIAPYIEKYQPTAVLLTGGGADISGINAIVQKTFGIPVKNMGENAAVESCASYIWGLESARVAEYLANRKKWEARFGRFAKFWTQRRKPVRRFIPILPSSASFDMTDPAIHKMFSSAGISMLHIDIIDGFYVDRIQSGIEELRNIRKLTNAHLHVHLMTESPVIWATAAADAGADTIIISTGTAGVRNAIHEIKKLGKRAGIALHPDSDLEILKPILREIDEVMIMAVRPGPSGQEFLPSALHKTSTLANTRRRFDLKLKISVDGGINNVTAAQCWDAGADFLTSGNYLKTSPDFAVAVNSLINN